MTSTVRHPTVLWAQREDLVYLTVDLHDAQNAKIDLKADSIDFNGTSDGLDYAFHLDFYAPVKPSDSKRSLTGRKTFLVLHKAEAAWWPRLTKEKAKLNFVKTDFEHWADEDDSEDEKPAFPGMDFSQFGDLSGLSESMASTRAAYDSDEDLPTDDEQDQDDEQPK